MPSRKRPVNIHPDKSHPIPYNTEPEQPESGLDDLAIAAETAELLEALGAMDSLPDADESTVKAEKRLLERALRGETGQKIHTLPAALGAAHFLKTYGEAVALDIGQVRHALTNKLLTLADCGDPKFELRAIELLGKHSDIGLFTDRSEVTVKYNSAESLESAIRDKVKRLMAAEAAETPVKGLGLEIDLGFHEVVEGEYEEVLAENPAPQAEPEEKGDENGE